MEVRELDSVTRPRYANRLDSYKAELKRLGIELKSKSTSYQDGELFKKKYKKFVIKCYRLFTFLSGLSEDNVSLYGDASSAGFQEDQRQRLLDNTEKIERTGRQLQAGYRIALETEEVGSAVLRDLHSQRETIQRSRNRVS